MMVMLDIVREYAERYGGQCEIAGEGLLQATLEAGEYRYPLLMHLVEHWLLMTVSTLIKPSPAQLDAAFYRRLLRWNLEFKLARVTLDESGYVIIALDLPTDELLIYPLFELAVDVLSYYTDLVTKQLLPLVATEQGSA